MQSQIHYRRSYKTRPKGAVQMNDRSIELRLQMDLRDYFAAKAMQALMMMIEGGKEYQAALVPRTAYDMADIMLKEREK
jgi:hypothetical protein